MRYDVAPMNLNDLPRIVEIEKNAYPLSQWPVSAYHRELKDNNWAHYIVVRDQLLRTKPVASVMPRRAFPFSLFQPREAVVGNEGSLAAIVGFAGLWMMIDEAHITTIATHSTVRRRGLGELLLVSLIDIAYSINARWVTLEVRVSNLAAQALYQKYGFAVVSTRPRYYSDNNEDAYIMWTEEIHTTAYRYMFDGHKSRLLERLAKDDFVRG